MNQKRTMRIAACFLSAMLVAGIFFGWNGAIRIFAEENEEILIEDPQEPAGAENESFPDDEAGGSDFELDDFIMEETAEDSGEIIPGSDADFPDGTGAEETPAAEGPAADPDDPSTDLAGTSDFTQETGEETAGTPEPAVSAEDLSEEGTYIGDWEEEYGDETISYEISLVLNSGKFVYYIRTIADCMDYDDTEEITGIYSISNGTITFNDRNERLKSGTLENESLKIRGILTAFTSDSKEIELSMESESVEEITEPNLEDPVKNINLAVTDQNGLRAGRYSLTEESYDASAPLKPKADILIDMEKLTFRVLDQNRDEKSIGTFEYDPDQGYYVMTYSDDMEEDLSASFKDFGPSGAEVEEDYYDDPDDEDEEEEFEDCFVLSGDGIRFLSALQFGDGYINTVNEEGDFLPYTAMYAQVQLEGDFEDILSEGEEETPERERSTVTLTPFPLVPTSTPRPTAEARSTTTANTGDPNRTGALLLAVLLSGAGIYAAAVRKEK